MEAEDYDAAKQLKRDIDRMRLSGDVKPAAAARAPSPPLPGRGVMRLGAPGTEFPMRVRSPLAPWQMPASRDIIPCSWLPSSPLCNAIRHPHEHFEISCSPNRLPVQHAYPCSGDCSCFRLVCKQDCSAASQSAKQHRRSSAAESVDPQQRSPSHHLDAEASPTGSHLPPLPQ